MCTLLRFAQFLLFFGRTLSVALGYALNSDASCTYMYIFAWASGVNAPPECVCVYVYVSLLCMCGSVCVTRTGTTRSNALS